MAVETGCVDGSRGVLLFGALLGVGVVESSTHRNDTLPVLCGPADSTACATAVFPNFVPRRECLPPINPARTCLPEISRCCCYSYCRDHLL